MDLLLEDAQLKISNTKVSFEFIEDNFYLNIFDTDMDNIKKIYNSLKKTDFFFINNKILFNFKNTFLVTFPQEVFTYKDYTYSLLQFTKIKEGKNMVKFNCYDKNNNLLYQHISTGNNALNRIEYKKSFNDETLQMIKSNKDNSFFEIIRIIKNNPEGYCELNDENDLKVIFQNRTFIDIDCKYNDFTKSEIILFTIDEGE